MLTVHWSAVARDVPGEVAVAGLLVEGQAEGTLLLEDDVVPAVDEPAAAGAGELTARSLTQGPQRVLGHGPADGRGQSRYLTTHLFKTENISLVLICITAASE